MSEQGSAKDRTKAGAKSARSILALTTSHRNFFDNKALNQRFDCLIRGLKCEVISDINFCDQIELKIVKVADDFDDKRLNFGFFYDNDVKLVVEIEYTYGNEKKIRDCFSHVFEDIDESRNIQPFVNIALRSFFEYFCQNFLICLQITSPGDFVYHSGITVIDDEFRQADFNLINIQMLKDVEQTHGLRLLRSLDFKDTWDWYKNLGGVFQGVSKKPIELAVTNLISLLQGGHEVTGGKNLVWSFAGIESLLAENENGIVSQLRSKLIAIFGNHVDIKNFDKIIRDLYQERSKIIHGKKERVSSIRSGNWFLSGKSEPDEMSITILILIALLQYCCQNKIDEIKFKTVVV